MAAGHTSYGQQRSQVPKPGELGGGGGGWLHSRLGVWSCRNSTSSNAATASVERGEGLHSTREHLFCRQRCAHEDGAELGHECLGKRMV